ncbi:exodeoxyribonuclease VII large subunit [Lachnospiraceae bacterium ZAX-1]
MAKSIYSVGQVNAYIKNMFDQDFMMNKIYVKGEASNCKYHTSGHLYFTLKDGTGALRAVMFAGNRKGLAFPMKNGDNVIALGSVAVYERDGTYQMYVREIILDGVGVLYQRFEALKLELAEMGMFAPQYKRPIPKYIKTLGIVTAPTGAAIQDIKTISARRNPYVRLILYPAIVQGEGAAQSIVNGIRALEQFGVDAMIIGRGGGSMEDLWAFNEEVVAHAIFECSIPIISAVGHETDTTIADFVADLRAPTPSAAAELAVYDVRDFGNMLMAIELQMNRILNSRLELCHARLSEYKAKLLKFNPESQINEKRQLWVVLQQKMQWQMEQKVEKSHKRLVELQPKLQRAMEQKVMENRHRMEIYAGRLAGMSPLKKLSQGYAYVTGQNGEGISNVKQLAEKEKIKIHMQNGVVTASVEEIQEIERREAAAYAEGGI